MTTLIHVQKTSGTCRKFERASNFLAPFCHWNFGLRRVFSQNADHMNLNTLIKKTFISNAPDSAKSYENSS